MSILIKGAKMPKNCIFCPCLDKDLQICEVLKRDMDIFEDKLPDCPLVEIPPHADLIDANELHVDIEQDISVAEEVATYNLSERDRTRVSQYIVGRKELLCKIDNAPTVIESEEE